MAGGIDWFRWHHGSVTDPKFQLVARRAGSSLSDVLAVWAYVLEAASAATERGSFSEIDCEALDCLFGFPATETRTQNILSAMGQRGLLDDGRVVQWERRQPKREREDDGAADRKRQQRAREADASQVQPKQANEEQVTQCHATSRQKTPRGEESREEEPSSPSVKKAARKRADPPPERPEDVDRQVWLDWTALRVKKSANVTQTVLAEARKESEKAGMTLEAFLRVWCLRGTQGLQAEWLKPHERGGSVIPINRQEAIEQRNRAVGDEWLREQEAMDASR